MNSGYDLGKFGSKDPEELAQARLTKTVTPLLEFNKLLSTVNQARAKGPVYDSTWTVLECLVFEIDRLNHELADLKKNLPS